MAESGIPRQRIRAPRRQIRHARPYDGRPPSANKPTRVDELNGLRVLLSAHLIHRVIEKPLMDFGKKFDRRPRKEAAGESAVIEGVASE